MQYTTVTYRGPEIETSTRWHPRRFWEAANDGKGCINTSTSGLMELLFLGRVGLSAPSCIHFYSAFNIHSKLGVRLS